MSVSTDAPFSELTTLGIKFYEENLKTLLESNHVGEFVAIESYLRKYFVNKDGTQVLPDARRAAR